MRESIIVVGQGVDAASIAGDRIDKGAIFKNGAPFTSSITEVMDYNKYSNNYSRASRSLWQTCRR